MLRQSLLALPFILCGCANIIQSVDLAPGQTPDITSNVDFVVRGSGTCDLVLDWGDGSKDVVDDAALANNPHFLHTFRGWRGGKTVTVTPVSPNDCKGMARTRFVTTPAEAMLGWARNPRATPGAASTFPADLSSTRTRS